MRKLIWVASGLLVGLICAGIIAEVQASRNSSGTYSLPTPGVPFQSNQTISSTQVNNTLNDIATALTDSKSKSGLGDFTAAVRGVDGTVAAPAYSYTSETGSGQYRIGASDLGWAVSGTKKLELTASLFTVTPNTLFSGSLGVGAASPSVNSSNPLYIKGVTNHGYVAADTDSHVTKEVGFFLLNAGSTSWEIYNPANSTDLRFYDGTADRITLKNGGGLVIGSGGTSITKSIRGTTVWDPGMIAGVGGTQTTTITVTGAAAGADCIVTPPALIGTPYSVVPTCWVTADTCHIQIDAFVAGQDLTSDTWACRVFNP